MQRLRLRAPSYRPPEDSQGKGGGRGKPRAYATAFRSFRPPMPPRAALSGTHGFRSLLAGGVGGKMTVNLLYGQNSAIASVPVLLHTYTNRALRA
jgi:hypothetical protein